MPETQPETRWNSDRIQILIQGLKKGLKKGVGSFIWICRIIVPISFLVTLLNWTGWLNVLDPFFQPVMALIHLPPQAALPLLTGLLFEFYPAFGMMAAIPFSTEQLTLIAVFIMIAHSLIIEGVIQHRSGMNFIKINFIRLVSAVAMVLIVSLFFENTTQPVPLPARLAGEAALLQVLYLWMKATVILCLKILCIIMVITTIFELINLLGWKEKVVKFFQPLMVLLGLPKSAAPIWVAGALFGIVYGGAIMKDETEAGNLRKEELERLHITLGINHSVVEDPALYLALGINIFWILVPRFTVALAAVHCYRAILWMRTLK